MTNEEIEELVKKARDGDECAITDLCNYMKRKNGASLQEAAHKYYICHSDQDDIMQEILLRICKYIYNNNIVHNWNGLMSKQVGYSVGDYVRARSEYEKNNRAIQIYRRIKYRCNEYDYEAMWQCFKKLSLIERQVLRLRYLTRKPFTNNVIAEKLDLHRHTVKAHIDNALSKMKQMLTAMDVDIRRKEVEYEQAYKI